MPNAADVIGGAVGGARFERAGGDGGAPMDADDMILLRMVDGRPELIRRQFLASIVKDRTKLNAVPC